MKKIPLRKCLITKESFPQKELFRIVRTPNNEVYLDSSYRINGRGAYLQKSLEVINEAKKKKVLDRALEIKVPDEIYDRMINFLKMK